MAKARDRSWRNRGVAAGHSRGCEGLVEPHIEFADNPARWRVVHRCACKADNRSDGWRLQLVEAEDDLFRYIRRASDARGRPQ
jgi:hypothetical protein